MTEPENEIKKTVAISVMVQVDTAGEQHVDVEFHSFLYV